MVKSIIDRIRFLEYFWLEISIDHHFKLTASIPIFLSPSGHLRTIWCDNSFKRGTAFDEILFKFKLSIFKEDRLKVFGVCECQMSDAFA